MKKKIVSLFFFIASLPGIIFPAGWLTLDIDNLMANIDKLYSTYDHINHTIEGVQNTYKQLETQIKNMQKMDWSDLQGLAANMDNPSDLASAWNDIGQFRDNLQQSIKVINRNMNLVNDVKHTLENKTVDFGGKKYTVAGLFGVGHYGENTLFGLPKTASEYVKDVAEDMAKDWKEGLSYKERETIWRKWGMSPENFCYVRMAEEQANVLVDSLLTTTDPEYYYKELDEAINSNNAIMDLGKGVGESTVGQLQVTTGAILDLKMSLINMNKDLRDLTGFFVKEKVAQDARDEAEREKQLTKEKQFVMEVTKYLEPNDAL